MYGERICILTCGEVLRRGRSCLLILRLVMDYRGRDSTVRRHDMYMVVSIPFSLFVQLSECALLVFFLNLSILLLLKFL